MKICVYTKVVLSTDLVKMALAYYQREICGRVIDEGSVVMSIEDSSFIISDEDLWVCH